MAHARKYTRAIAVPGKLPSITRDFAFRPKYATVARIKAIDLIEGHVWSLAAGSKTDE